MDETKQHNSEIERIIQCAKQITDPVEFQSLSEFIPQYYQNIAMQELRDRSIADLYGAVFSHWKLACNREAHGINLNVYNPDEVRDGWQSKYTIIQLVCDDMPFLVDSLRLALNRQGLTLRFLITLEDVKLRYAPPEGISALNEAVIYIEVDKQLDAPLLEPLRSDLYRVLQDIKMAVTDRQAMHLQVDLAMQELEGVKASLNSEDVAEAKAFLAWMLEQFTFLGYRLYTLEGTGKDCALCLIEDSGLGVLRDSKTGKPSRYYADLPPEARKQALSKQILIIAKTNTESTVCRDTYTDYIGVKRFDQFGNIVGEHRFIGLFTADVYDSDPVRIPVLRRHVATLMQRFNFDSNSRKTKSLLHVLRTLPRDDLFQSSAEDLYELVRGIMSLEERRCVRFFARKDTYNRYVSCFVYVPRDNFNMELCYRMQQILLEAFAGLAITFTPYFSESILARIHFVVRIDAKKPVDYDLQAIEKSLVQIGYSWKDELTTLLLEKFANKKANALIHRYIAAFPAGYREIFEPRAAIFDIEHLEELSAGNTLGISFYHLPTAKGTAIHVKLFRPDQTVSLSDVLPMLENMGLRVLDEDPYEVNLTDGSKLWINDFNVAYYHHDTLDIEMVRDNFKDAFNKTWCGEVENDGFNRLVLGARLSWREISVLRAYAKYLRQAGFTFSQDYIEESLTKNPAVVRLLIEIFKLRFDPDQKDMVAKEMDSFLGQFQQALDLVASLDEDRILRRFLNVIQATIRTNYYQLDAQFEPKSYLAFKLDPLLVPELPLPLPMIEIFVYSPRFEGIHLRKSKIARGGLRWSDRREDFRTEVLGLMKAQQVKNALIVPSGAKGGFVPKLLPVDGNREAILDEAIACYKSFIRGLLDVTDNIVAGNVVTPPNTVCYDDEDTYLVVAADKGTATFSDIANAISKEYGHWLGDAFASGGSAGYDHKKLGITARGAWESVKRHFRELDININANFTVVGIGDMSGDVFGNGVLLSKHIKLVAAFNHMHIFLDPDPDAAASYTERVRMFELNRSTWEDYDPSLISEGGGIYKRSVKAIVVSQQVKDLLRLNKDSVEPNELIRAILTAPVDLLWNGGIGTYVKAVNETHNDVGDHANDNLRVNGKQLQCRVVGEGGNLGFTQLARVEYELSGGRINTDFIDNAGGVNCSDHEVNIKILLNEVVTCGNLTGQERDQLLADMSSEVADLVLHDNDQQNLAISLAVRQLPESFNLYQKYIDEQERTGHLNRALEFLPDSKVLLDRQANGMWLTRPEIAVLLAYSKIIFKEAVLASDLPEDPYLGKYAFLVFPKLLRERFAKQIKEHRLRREITATQLGNTVVADMGITFIYQMQDEMDATVPAIVRAYVIAREVFGMASLRHEIESHNRVAAAIQIDMMHEVTRLVRRATRWFLRDHHGHLNIEEVIKHFAPRVEKLYGILPTLLGGAQKNYFNKRKRELIKENVNVSTATRLAGIRAIYPVLNIIEAVSEGKSGDYEELAVVYFVLAERLGLNWLREEINVYPVSSRWDVLARAALKADLDKQQRMLTLAAIRLKSKARGVTACVDAWFIKHPHLVSRWQLMLTDLRSRAKIEFTMLSVAVRELARLASSFGAREG